VHDPKCRDPKSSQPKWLLAKRENNTMK
jgi:hypothetical protein